MANRSGGYACGNFVNSRIDDRRDSHFGRAVENFVEPHQHLRIRSGVVGFSVFHAVPQTDCGHICFPLKCKSDLVAEPRLFSQYGEDILFERLSELAQGVGFQT